MPRERKIEKQNEKKENPPKKERKIDVFILGKKKIEESKKRAERN